MSDSDSILSPHGPRQPGSWQLVYYSMIRADSQSFGHLAQYEDFEQVGCRIKYPKTPTRTTSLKTSASVKCVACGATNVASIYDSFGPGTSCVMFPCINKLIPRLLLSDCRILLQPILFVLRFFVNLSQ